MPELERALCGAKSRRNGGAPCRNPPVRGCKRCRMHGAKTTGKPSPTLRHGLRSAFIPKDMLPDVLGYARLLEAPEGAKVLLKADAAVAAARKDRVAASDLDSFVKAGDAMRKDLATVAQLEQAERDAAPAVEAVINYVQPNLSLATVRGPDGSPALLVKLGDGRALLETSPGSFQLAETFTLADCECWRPRQLLEAPTQPDDPTDWPNESDIHQ